MPRAYRNHLTEHRRQNVPACPPVDAKRIRARLEVSKDKLTSSAVGGPDISVLRERSHARSHAGLGSTGSDVLGR